MTYHERMRTIWRFWKSGMNMFEISEAIGLPEFEVEQVIFDLIQQKKKAA